MSYHIVVKPGRKLKYRDDWKDQYGHRYEKISDPTVVSYDNFSFKAPTPEAAPILALEPDLKSEATATPLTEKIIKPTPNTSLIALYPIDLIEFPIENIPSSDPDFFPDDRLAASFVELFEAISFDLPYPLRIQLQIMPPAVLPSSEEENLTIKINMQMTGVADAVDIALINNSNRIINDLETLKTETNNDTLNSDFGFIDESENLGMPFPSESSSWYESVSFEMEMPQALYENLAYLASKDAVSKFMICNLNFFLFYGYTPMTTGLQYVDTGLKGATFSAINAFTSPFFINFLAEPIYDFGKSLISEDKTPVRSLSLGDIFDNMQDLWHESLSEIKPLSEGQLGTSGIYSATSKFIRDSICNSVGNHMLCRVLNSLPASNIVKNTLKANFGDNLFQEIEQLSLWSHGELIPELPILESTGLF